MHLQRHPFLVGVEAFDNGKMSCAEDCIDFDPNLNPPTRAFPLIPTPKSDKTWKKESGLLPDGFMKISIRYQNILSPSPPPPSAPPHTHTHTHTHTRTNSPYYISFINNSYFAGWSIFVQILWRAKIHAIIVIIHSDGASYMELMLVIHFSFQFLNRTT